MGRGAGGETGKSPAAAAAHEKEDGVEERRAQLLESASSSKGLKPDSLARLTRFWEGTVGSSCGNLSAIYPTRDLPSHIICGLLRVQSLQRGRVTCLFSVKAPVINAYGGMHGGVVATIAELVSIGAARTVVAEDKELFLGELSTSYLSGAPLNVGSIMEWTAWADHCLEEFL